MILSLLTHTYNVSGKQSLQYSRHNSNKLDNFVILTRTILKLKLTEKVENVAQQHSNKSQVK